jgi:hypothetical protein
LCLVAVVATACGGASPSVHPPTTTRPPAASLDRVVDAGRLTFKIPSSWTVGYGTCRCGWGVPDTATLDNGPQAAGGVACNCPAEISSAPSGLHLYEGQAGLVAGGSPATINGVRAQVGLDVAEASLTATFPDIDQWITISPAPPSGTGASRLRQVALERQILATVTVLPGGAGTSQGVGPGGG